MTNYINKQKAKNSLQNEKIQEAEKIITILHLAIEEDQVLTNEMLKQVKNHCKKLMKSDF